MKITAIEKFSQTNILKRNNDRTVSNPQPSVNRDFLSLYNTKGLNISFGRLFERPMQGGKHTKVVMDKIYLYKKEVATLKERLPFLKTDAERKAHQKHIEYLSEFILQLGREKLLPAVVKDDIVYTMNNEGGVHETIFGYSDLINNITRTFFRPYQESIKTGNPDISVPSAIMLYGASGCGKTAIMRAIQTGYRRVTNNVVFTPQDPNNFTRELFNILRNARTHYLKTSKEKEYGERTLILIDNAEKYLAESPDNIDLSETLYSRTDIKNLEKYNQIYNCPANVNALKSALDYISKLPEDEKSEGCAATILFTTQSPHLIHRDLISRDGEFGKMLTFAVRPAADLDLLLVLDHYFSIVSYILNSVKNNTTAETLDEIINEIPGMTDKARFMLNRKMRDNTIKNLHIAPFAEKLKDMYTFITDKNPSLSKGAYSNARWKDIIYKAFIDYLENPDKPFENYFIEETMKFGVDITPENYKRFENICNMVENPEKFKQRKLVNISKKLQDMIDDYRDGLISDKNKEILKLKIQDIERRYTALQNKENLSPAEKRIKNQYKTFLDSVTDIEFPD